MNFVLRMASIIFAASGLSGAIGEASANSNAFIAGSCVQNSSNVVVQTEWRRHTNNNPNPGDWGDPIVIDIPPGGRDCRKWDNFTWGFRAEIKFRNPSYGTSTPRTYGMFMSEPKEEWIAVCIRGLAWKRNATNYADQSYFYAADGTLTVSGAYSESASTISCSDFVRSR